MFGQELPFILMIKSWWMGLGTFGLFFGFPHRELNVLCRACCEALAWDPESWEWDVGYSVQWMVPVCWAGGAGGLKMFAGTWLRLLPGTGSQWPHPFHHQPRPRHWPLTRQYTTLTTHLITRAWISNQLHGYVSTFLASFLDTTLYSIVDITFSRPVLLH